MIDQTPMRWARLDRHATIEEQLDQATRVLHAAVHLLAAADVDEHSWQCQRGQIGTAAMNLHAVSRVSAASGI